MATCIIPVLFGQQASLQLDGEVRSQLPSWLTLIGFATLEAARRANLTRWVLHPGSPTE